MAGFIRSAIEDASPAGLAVGAGVVVLSVLVMVGLPFIGSSWSVKGKHIFITGGSQGLGLALAELVASKGADVTICARSKDKLEQAAEKIRQAAQSPAQRIAFVSADVSQFDGAKNALATASGKASSDAEQVGRVPDAVFCCAGGAKPGFFLEQTQADFEQGFRTDYMTALATSHAAATLFVRSAKRDAKIVLVGSTLSFMGLVGYSQYTPMKWAIRGLAESLRSEFNLYPDCVGVHAYFPGTILSPGYENENKTKPEITVKIEGGDAGGLTPAQCAKAMLRGVERGQFFTTSDFDTELHRAGTAAVGIVPGNNWLLDRCKGLICLIAIPIWRTFTADSAIQQYAKERHPSLVGLPSDTASR